MAPPAFIERALTLVGLKPTCAPKILTSYQSALVISMLLIVDHCQFLDTAASVMLLLVPCRHICATCLLTDYNAHTRGRPVSFCPINSPLTSLLCVAKRRMMKFSVTQV